MRLHQALFLGLGVGLAAAQVEDEPFQSVSQCSSWVIDSTASTSGWNWGSVRGTALLQLAVPGGVDQISNHYDFNDRDTWVNGTTRLSVDVQFGDGPGPVATSAVAHVHGQPCASGMGGPHYVHDLCFGNCPDPEETPENIIQVNISLAGTDGTGQEDRPWLADYDSARSVVIHNPDSGDKWACCDMVPPFPELPADWTATIEAVISNKGYTYTRREAYSTTLNRVRIEEHSHVHTQVQLHVPGDKIYKLVRNDSYPDGVCEQAGWTNRTSFELTPGTTQLRSTASMLFFNKSEAVYEPGSHVVRGIPCEKWVHAFTFNTSTGLASYSTAYYFPVTHWQVRRESYHRLLKRVHLTGTHGDGSAVDHYYEYVDMRPYVDAWDVNLCKVFDGVEGCGCGTGGAPPSMPDDCQCENCQDKPCTDTCDDTQCEDCPSCSSCDTQVSDALSQECALRRVSTSSSAKFDFDGDGVITADEIGSARVNGTTCGDLEKEFALLAVIGIGASVLLGTALCCTCFWVVFYKLRVGVLPSDRLAPQSLKFSSNPINWEDAGPL